ncbi:MAG: hypothetical protein ACYCR7_03215 [Thermoplasmataceae archaeon]
MNVERLLVAEVSDSKKTDIQNLGIPFLHGTFIWNCLCSIKIWQLPGIAEGEINSTNEKEDGS